MKALKHKKWIIALAVIVAIIGLIVLLSFTVFSLKSVEVDYRTSTQNITVSKDEIIKSGKFKKGASVFFHKKDDYIKRIEEFNPYIKVINIETVFPSKFVIHISERQEVYAFERESGYYICDENLRILRKPDEAENLPITIEMSEKLSDSYDVGAYLKVEMPDIYNGFLYNNRTLGRQTALLEKVSLATEYDENIKKFQSVSVYKFRSGHIFKIYNDSYGYKYKVRLMLDVFSQMDKLVGANINGKEITREDLDSCVFAIYNYYNYTEHGEDDCWFDIQTK